VWALPKKIKIKREVGRVGFAHRKTGKKRMESRVGSAHQKKKEKKQKRKKRASPIKN